MFGYEKRKYDPNKKYKRLVEPIDYLAFYTFILSFSTMLILGFTTKSGLVKITPIVQWSFMLSLFAWILIMTQTRWIVLKEIGDKDQKSD